LRRTLSISAILMAWLFANASACDVIQVVAWGRMFAGYTRTMNIGQSLRETFDSAKPCRLCIAAGKARAASAKHDSSSTASAARGLNKLVMSFQPSAPFYFSTSAVSWGEIPAVAAPERTEAVPVPPPRSAVPTFA
jgi:hypothetical protein